MERELPTTAIKGTTFVVDVVKQELRELENPENVISFLNMKDHGTHYSLQYDPKVKNLPGLFSEGICVEISQMVVLDPVGMSLIHNKSIEELKGKTDYEIIVNQDLVQLRKSGFLPILSIAEHPFFVDIRLGSLRPKDDFSTLGIEFSIIDYCLAMDDSAYIIPYNPSSKSFVDIDFNLITEIPKGIILVEIPYESKLDPIGYARKYEIDEKSLLRQFPPEANMKARIIPWSETPVQGIIDNNKKRQMKSVPKKGRKMQ